MRIHKFLFVILVIFLGSIFCQDKTLCMGTKPEDAPKITGTAGARGIGEEEEEKTGIGTDIEEKEIVITKLELEQFLEEGGLGRWRK
ncbi:hypothetical protein KJ693_08205 [bacterium]|nr:hypothetical protein [bacterium]MBU1615282.1 hypothetical protein [bacterium]